jgi:ABC-type glycerol-3-phosphate transport system substrate-binding protein
MRYPGLACLCLVLVACAGVAPTPEPVTIAFAYLELDTEYYERLVSLFNESHSHITVDLEPQSFQSIYRLDLVQIDVFWLMSETTFAPLVEQGKLVGLTPYVEGNRGFDLDDFHAAGVEFYSVDGELWALPVAVDPVVMYYNMDLFDRYGVPYPANDWTWTDFLDAALALRDPGANVFGYAAGNTDPLWFVYQHGGRILDDWRDPTRTTFDDPLTIEALQWYSSLIHEHDVAPTHDQAYQAFIGSGSAEYGFLTGRVGMLMGQFFEQGGTVWMREWDMNWGMVPLPRDAQAATLAFSFAHAVSAQSAHPEACWQWLVFLSGQMPARGVPARQSLAGSKAYSDQVGADIAAVARISMENALPPFYMRNESVKAVEDFQRAVDYVTNEGMSPQEALDWVQRNTQFK